MRQKIFWIRISIYVPWTQKITKLFVHGIIKYLVKPENYLGLFLCHNNYCHTCQLIFEIIWKLAEIEKSSKKYPVKKYIYEIQMRLHKDFCHTLQDQTCRCLAYRVMVRRVRSQKQIAPMSCTDSRPTKNDTSQLNFWRVRYLKKELNDWFSPILISKFWRKLLCPKL